MSAAKPRCRWCGKQLPKADEERYQKLDCDNAHRVKYLRAQRAATLADLVEALGPHVDEAGIFIYRDLVDHLAGKVNAEV